MPLAKEVDWIEQVGAGSLFHLSHSIRRFSPEDLYCMFTGYFDAAGGADHGFTVVGGYVATLRQWDRFEADWRILLARYHLRYFTMKECAHWTGEFARWNRDESRRASFLSDAVEIIASNVIAGVACRVDWSIFEAVNKQYPLKEIFGHPYALAGRDCVAKINDTVRENGGTPAQIEYVFENGDQGKGHLLNVMSHDLASAPIFKPSRDQYNPKTGVLEKAVVPIQAADFAAYELRKAMVDDPREQWLPHQYRKSLRALSKIKGFWGQYRHDDLIQMCERAGVLKRATIMS